MSHRPHSMHNVIAKFGQLAPLLLVAMLASACGGRMFGRSYEYEEDIYVSLDGSAEIILNASIPALVMLRGLDLPEKPDLA